MSSARLPLHRGAFDRTRDHWWWREGWGPGRRYLTWHLTFETATALHETAERAAGFLRRLPGVDVVPVEWLHLTMTGVGFADELDPPARKAVADAGFEAASGIPLAPLVFDRLFLYQEGLCLSATSPALQELKARQVEAVRRAGGQAAAAEVFHPHVSLAYFSSEIDESALDDALERAAIGQVSVSSPRLSLLEIGRDEHVYTWRVLAQRVLTDWKASGRPRREAQ
jgi:2'-5' RNA ligase